MIINHGISVSSHLALLENIGHRIALRQCLFVLWRKSIFAFERSAASLVAGRRIRIKCKHHIEAATIRSSRCRVAEDDPREDKQF